MKQTLIFQGLARPSARISGRYQHTADASLDPAISIEAGPGAGRPYATATPLAFWRDFAELYYADEQRCLAFIRRRGDPIGKLDEGQPSGTGDWPWLQGPLRNIAAGAWGPLDENGVSHFLPDGGEAARLFATSLPAGIDDFYRVRFRGLEPVIEARNLAAFMVASALASLRQHKPMRRCRYCFGWFDLTHRAAEFCSAGCRSAFASKRKPPNHVISPETGLSVRDDLVGRPVAGAGQERRNSRPSAQLPNREGGEGVGRADGPGARGSRRRRPGPADA